MDSVTSGANTIRALVISQAWQKFIVSQPFRLHSFEIFGFQNGNFHLSQLPNYLEVILYWKEHSIEFKTSSLNYLNNCKVFFCRQHKILGGFQNFEPFLTGTKYLSQTPKLWVWCDFYGFEKVLVNLNIIWMMMFLNFLKQFKSFFLSIIRIKLICFAFGIHSATEHWVSRLRVTRFRQICTKPFQPY